MRTSSGGLSTRNGGVTLAAGMSMAVHARARARLESDRDIPRRWRLAAVLASSDRSRQLLKRKSLSPLRRRRKGIGTRRSPSSGERPGRSYILPLHCQWHPGLAYV
jgi:hypothetical protein